MAVPEDDIPAAETSAAPGLRLRRWHGLVLVVAAVVLSALGYVWATREQIAANYISSQLRTMGLAATYEVESIGTKREVLRNIVVGDPRHPDLTIERAEVQIRPRFGLPGIGEVTLIRPRLSGTYHQGKLSFGSLDKLLFGPSTGRKFRLPNLNLVVRDGRGRLVGDFGTLGFKVQGEGGLRDGFTGGLAVAAPSIRTSDCAVVGALLTGTLKVETEQPHFVGPLDMSQVDCPASGLALRNVNLGLDALLDRSFKGAESKATLRTGAVAWGAQRAAGLSGSSSLVWRKGALMAHYKLAGTGLTSTQAAARTLALEGSLRTAEGLTRLEAEGDLRARDVRLGNGLDAMLARFERSSASTLAAPLLAQIRSALRREAPGSRAEGSYILRKTGAVINLVIPRASLQGGSGASLLSLSRFQLTSGAQLAPRLAGNFMFGGPGLPQIAGRMERGSGGDMTLRATMADYRAGASRLALPQLLVVQAPGGSVGFAGSAVLSGALPGGQASNLAVPLDGNWSSRSGLALWRRCTPLRFDSLAVANLVLTRHAITLCPPSGSAILRADGRGTRIAAGAPSLDVTGRLGTTPIRIVSGPVGLAWPGALAARSLDIALGPPETASRFHIANLSAKIGQDIAGRFAEADVLLSAVPLDLLKANGAWRYAGGKLSIAGADFRLLDRRPDARFQPLVAHDGVLTLLNNQVQAAATLREPKSDREVTAVTVHSDLSTGRGEADLAVKGLTFDRAVQPDTLTRLALGVIANARGTVRGNGRIDWAPGDVTSTGQFTTETMDFAAAFGPVKGASGTIHFTDLLGMVTAPDQHLRVAAINPGIEVNDGDVVYALKPGLILAVQGGTWPFLDGTLRLEPVTMTLGASETRRYVLDIEGLNAAKFIERMGLANLTATGTFDGKLPLVFDQDGGRIEGGLLTSRPPGGNVSYVGALTYKDLSAMANFAFDALKSLDYRQMRIAMDGALAGEIVTRLRFDGVKQGTTARKNFITRRFANLPLQFNVNVRAPFYQLITSLKALYDPAYVRDPRTIGLVDKKGQPVAPAVTNPPPPPVKLPPPAPATPPPPALQPPAIQPPVSEKTP